MRSRVFYLVNERALTMATPSEKENERKRERRENEVHYGKIGERERQEC